MTHMTLSANLEFFKNIALNGHMLFYGGKGQKWQSIMNLMTSYVRYNNSSLMSL